MFKIGDRVKATALAQVGNADLKNGDTGTIINIDKCSDGLSIDVLWDRNVDGHDFFGKCAMWHGWCVIDDEVEKIESEE